MIKKIKILPDDLHVYFNNEREEIYPNIWLRDHARDEENWDKRSNQRKTFTATLDFKLKIKSADILDNGKSIKIIWPDLEKPVNYSYEFLFNNSLNNKSKIDSLKLWKENDLDDQIYIDFDTVQSNEGYKKFLKNLYQYGFSVVQNCKTEMSSVENIVNKIGYVRNSIFGGLWSFESNEDKADSAYTQEELRPHTDATYSNDAPGLQLLLCCDYKAKGGDSIMVDGFKIAEIIKKDNKELFEILSTINVKGSYIGDGVFLEAERPIFNLNSKKELFQVSFNNYDRAPFRFEKDLTIKFYEAIRTFDLMANSKEYQWRHILKPGELLIFNNWRVLHGRGSFDGTRKISGCYINKEDFDSSCKMNGIF
tara:strand:- start:115 stop:1212 length:1098 start_codon:yes stop_codon:yes gene_type:complete